MLITTTRVGSAAGTNGPVVFLASGANKGKNRTRGENRLFTENRLTEVYRLPKGSKVLVNKNAYMDDKTWVETVRVIAFGIEKMPVIQDHPDWWLLLMLDGFKLHVSVDKAHQIFYDHKIRVAKEEAGTPHVNQAYDQQQANHDKRQSPA